MQTTSQIPYVNNNYYFPASQPVLTPPVSTGDDDTEGRKQGVAGGGTWRERVTDQMGVLTRSVGDINTQMGNIGTQMGNIGSQMADQTRRTNDIDNAIRSVDGKLDKVDEGLKVLAQGQELSAKQAAALEAKVDGGFVALSKQLEDCCTKLIPHSPARPSSVTPNATRQQSSDGGVRAPVQGVVE
ncbi:MAG TPA: hypothetical protein VNE00_04760 [Paraburkholderia sp.]|jgi:hypothetical protein|nr:hypothetical protein [Paraburkholderia sp.]